MSSTACCRGGAAIVARSLADGRVDGPNLICGVHGWDYRMDTGVSSYDTSDRLRRFSQRRRRRQGGHRPRRTGRVPPRRGSVARRPGRRIRTSLSQRPWQHRRRSRSSPTSTSSPRTASTAAGHHGPVAAMGVERASLPSWDAIQFVTAQLAPLPAARRRSGRHRGRDRAERGKAAAARHPALRLRHELRRAVAGGQDRARSRRASSRAPASAPARAACCPRSRPRTRATSTSWPRPRFGWRETVLDEVQAFHFKVGQGAKTGTGGHLPGPKVVDASPRCAASPKARPRSRPPASVQFEDIAAIAEFVAWAKDRSGGIPIGAKLSAQHIEADIDAALDDRRRLHHPRRPRRRHRRGAAAVPRQHLGADDPRAGPGAASSRPLRTRPTSRSSSPAGSARAADFAKALALGADAVAIANSAIQAIGCLGMRACNTDNCPVGIATQKPHLRARLPVDEAAAATRSVPDGDRRVDAGAGSRLRPPARRRLRRR